MKIKWSALVGDVRNKLNGSVASKNRYGSYFRTKTTPVNPQTSYQQAARQILGNISSSWRALTESQRRSWDAGAVNFPFTDIFGDQLTLSGQALFIKLNSNLEKIGQPRIDTAPLPQGFDEVALTSASVTLTSGSISAMELSLNLATVPAGYSLAVYATPPINPGRSFVKNQFRFLGTAVVAANDADIQSMYTDRFGAAASAGQSIHFRVALVNNTTGQQSVPVSAVALLA